MEYLGYASEWFSVLPAEASDSARDLLSRVAALRSEEVIYPPQDDILNALSLTSPREVRAVILGQDPYHGPSQAMGLSFSVPCGQKLPPSLRNIYKELAADLECSMPPSGDLTPWAKRGVLLLNTTLTVREHAAGSHAKLGWQSVTKRVVEACFRQSQPIVFFAWGRHALNLIDDAANEVLSASPNRMGSPSPGSDASGFLGVAEPVEHKFVIASTHPSPLSASRAAGNIAPFMGSRPFSRANELLVRSGSLPIDWTCLCEEGQDRSQGTLDLGI